MKKLASQIYFFESLKMNLKGDQNKHMELNLILKQLSYRKVIREFEFNSGIHQAALNFSESLPFTTGLLLGHF